MKKLLFVLLPLLGIAISYLMISFVALNFNFMQWSATMRAGTLMLWIVSIIFGIILARDLNL